MLVSRNRMAMASPPNQTGLAPALSEDPSVLHAQLSPAISRAAKIIGSKYNIDVDDLAQEVTLVMLYGTGAKNYDISQPLLPYMIGLAARVGLGMRRRDRMATELPVSSLMDEDEGALFFERSCTTETADMDVLVGIAKIVEAKSSMGTANGKAVDAPRQAFKRPREKTITAVHRRFREIRLALGLSKRNYALALHITHASVDAYEYGKTLTIPENVMESTESLIENIASEKVESRSIHDLLLDWAKVLGLRFEDNNALAKQFGTTATTIRRWKAGAASPSSQKVRHLKAIAENYSGETLRRDMRSLLGILISTMASSNDLVLLDYVLVHRILAMTEGRAEFTIMSSMLTDMAAKESNGYVVADVRSMKAFVDQCKALGLVA